MDAFFMPKILLHNPGAPTMTDHLQAATPAAVISTKTCRRGVGVGHYHTDSGGREERGICRQVPDAPEKLRLKSVLFR